MAIDYRGVLFIGDPHLASQVPGFRKDDFPRTVLKKLDWSLAYARQERLLPAVLGDLFHYPRDNANWLLCEVIVLLSQQEVIAIYGNHDCREDSLQEHDSFSILEAAKMLCRVEEEGMWTGRMNGRAVAVGGSSRHQKLPKPRDRSGDELVIWLTHHDLNIPGFEQGVIRPKELPGIDLVVNGHIHRSLEPVVCGETTWLTPGNITRIGRSDASREHTPSVMRLDIGPSGWEIMRIPLPHEPFEAVFHAEVGDGSQPEEIGSMFIRGLKELESLHTAEGAGFVSFLEKNLQQFDKAVQDAIWALWKEVTPNAEIGRNDRT